MLVGRRIMKELTTEDLKIIFDVLNVYDPNDIQHIYPQMGEQEFLDDVRRVWGKLLLHLNGKRIKRVGKQPPSQIASK